MNSWIVIGISGVTCGGKTTLAKALKARYHGSITFLQDDYFLPEDSDKLVLIPELNHFNWDVLSAFDMEKMRSDIINTLNSKCEGEFPLIIIEGVLIFNDEKLSKLWDKKYYLTLPYETCLERRSKRIYNPPDVPGYFEKCVWPEHIKSKEEVFEMHSNVDCIDSSTDIEVIREKVFCEIDELLANFKLKTNSE